jgi:hypothetical protein
MVIMSIPTAPKHARTCSSPLVTYIWIPQTLSSNHKFCTTPVGSKWSHQLPLNIDFSNETHPWISVW